MLREIRFLDHIEELRIRLLRIIVAVSAIMLFCFLFEIRRFQFGKILVYLPYPNPFNNIAALVIKRLQSDMLPQNVKLIVTSPSQPIIAQLYVSIFLGVLFGMPVIVYEVASFVGPALYPHETRWLRRLIVPAAALFAAGALFAYTFITPMVIRFLYIYGFFLEAEMFITLNDLVTFVALFALAGGLSFQLPIVMWVVTKVGLVDVDFWRRNLSYAVVAIVIFGAVVTPDVSGVTMWLISAPMIVLYIAAYLIIRIQES